MGGASAKVPASHHAAVDVPDGTRDHDLAAPLEDHFGGSQAHAADAPDQLDALATALSNTYDAIWKIIQAERMLRADERSSWSKGRTKCMSTRRPF